MEIRNPNRQEVVASIITGIENAQRDYKKAFESHINNSIYSPEYLMTVYIFQSLLEFKKECGCLYGLSLEQSVHDIVTRLKTGRRGNYPKNLRVYGKCDLTLWDVNTTEDDEPLAVIEVKEDPWKYNSDIKRLAGLVERGLPFGIFASCYFVEIVDNKPDKADIRLEKEAQCILEHIISDIGIPGLNVINNLGPKYTLKLDGNQARWRWCTFCFVITDERK